MIATAMFSRILGNLAIERGQRQVTLYQLAALLSPPSEEMRSSLIAAHISIGQLPAEMAEKEFHFETVPWLVGLNTTFQECHGRLIESFRFPREESLKSLDITTG